MQSNCNCCAMGTRGKLESETEGPMRMQPSVIYVLFTNGTPWGERGAGVCSGLPESVLVCLLVRNDARLAFALDNSY